MADFDDTLTLLSPVNWNFHWNWKKKRVSDEIGENQFFTLEIQNYFFLLNWIAKILAIHPRDCCIEMCSRGETLPQSAGSDPGLWQLHEQRQTRRSIRLQAVESRLSRHTQGALRQIAHPPPCDRRVHRAEIPRTASFPRRAQVHRQGGWRLEN